MNKLIDLFKTLLPDLATAQTRDEAYLAAAVDNFDLERRMREIDRQPRVG